MHMIVNLCCLLSIYRNLRRSFIDLLECLVGTIHTLTSLYGPHMWVSVLAACGWVCWLHVDECVGCMWVSVLAACEWVCWLHVGECVGCMWVGVLAACG